ncbi:MAG: DUF3244 domain-containing protein [Bacteroidales bacterium]|nr:DUF3244 domain-containing protein [Candidatus Equimonas enterica]
MKKTIIFLIALLTTKISYCHANSSTTSRPIAMSLHINKDIQDKPYLPHMPPVQPMVDATGHTLLIEFGTSGMTYTVTLTDDNDAIIYRQVITATIDPYFVSLPSSIQGTYTLNITTYAATFEGEIVL